MFRRVGITFAVYGDTEAEERLIPFDIVPRILSGRNGHACRAVSAARQGAQHVPQGHLWHARTSCAPGSIPAELVYRNPYYRPQMHGHRLHSDIYVQVAGIDIVRVDDEDFYVLEDNLRTPSGVSYMLENREVMMRLFPDSVGACSASGRSRTISTSCSRPPIASRRRAAPASRPSSVLTPGALNSAYYEHSFLADQHGRGAGRGARPLRARRHGLYAHDRGAEAGRRDLQPHRRRLLDPLVFRPNSALGVPGLIAAYRAGNVDDRQCPRHGRCRRQGDVLLRAGIVRFYMGEEPILKNVPTWRCRERESTRLRPRQSARTGRQGGQWLGRLRHARRPACDPREHASISGPESWRRPDNYIAQPTLALSTSPIFTKKGLAPRHVDLRPFVLTGTRRGPHRAGRAHPRGADGRLARGEFKPGRRDQGYLGVERMSAGA